jgi:excisionase family DNA binding protein
MSGEEDSVMTLKELSVYLKIPASSLYKVVREGSIPGLKIGKHWRFNRLAIDEWISKGGKK